MTDKSLPIKKLVLTSGLPLFITIVGIGGADFSEVSCPLLLCTIYHYYMLITQMCELNDSVRVQDVVKFVPLRLCIHRIGTYFSLVKIVSILYIDLFILWSLEVHILHLFSATLIV